LASIARARTSCQRRVSIRLPDEAVTGFSYEVNPRRRLGEISERLQTAPSPLFEYTCCNQTFDRFE
jgi:hypothetical protein